MDCTNNHLKSKNSSPLSSTNLMMKKLLQPKQKLKLSTSPTQSIPSISALMLKLLSKPLKLSRMNSPDSPDKLDKTKENSLKINQSILQLLLNISPTLKYSFLKDKKLLRTKPESQVKNSKKLKDTSWKGA